MSFENYPAVVRSALAQEGAYITDHGVAKKQLNGGEELLVSYPNLTKQQFHLDAVGEKAEEKKPEVEEAKQPEVVTPPVDVPPVVEEAKQPEVAAPPVVEEVKQPEVPKVEEAKPAVEVKPKGKPGPKPKNQQPVEPAKETA